MQGNVIANDFSSGINYISVEKFENKLKSCEIFPNDILITARGTVGKFALVPQDAERGILHSSLIKLKLDLNVLNNDFALFIFNKSLIFKNYLNKILANTTIPALYAGNISSCEIYYPNMVQQCAIADILSAQESVIQDIESLISKYESRFQYLSEELLSGRLRVKEVDGQTILYKNADNNWKEVEVNGEMKEIPIDWNLSKVCDIFEVQRGKVLSKDYIQANIGSYPVYSSATENNGSIGSINSYMFNGKYLTWTTDGVYAGTVFYREGKFNCTNICGVLKDKTQNSLKGLFYFIKSELPKHVNHIGNSKLMSNTVSDISFIYPSKIEQGKIAQLLTYQELLIEQQKEFLATEKQKFDWLLDNLLSGKYLVQGQ